MSDLEKIFGVVQSTYGAFQEAVGKTGEKFREGRTIRYKATGYMYRWELHYRVEAVDLLTGITAEVNDHLNCSTAIDHAVDKVVEEVVKAQSVDGTTACASAIAPPTEIVLELNLRNLENALRSVPLTLSKTSSLGRTLGVPEYKLTEFSTNHNRDIAQVRTEILRYWLENQQCCSWGAIAGALFVIGEKELAEKIRVYRSPPDGDPEL